MANVSDDLERERLDAGWRCAGCGGAYHSDWLKAHEYISCCPERKLVDPPTLAAIKESKAQQRQENDDGT